MNGLAGRVVGGLVFCGGAAVLMGAVTLPALAQAGAEAAVDASAGRTNPALVGAWTGESIVDGVGVRRWTIERRTDGTYSAKVLRVTRTGPGEQDELGRWTALGDVLELQPDGGDAERQRFRYTATPDPDCWLMVALEPGTDQPARPEVRFGECRTPSRRAIPDELRRSCAMNLPGAAPGGTLDLRIVREADGRRFAVGDGQRDPQPVEVLDYPVLPGFDPRQPEAMTNAGEALLTLVQQYARDDRAFARRLGFEPGAARAVRVYVLTPPRASRPMEYYAAGRAVLFEAFDGEDRSLGMAMYFPFLVACPPAAP